VRVRVLEFRTATTLDAMLDDYYRAAWLPSGWTQASTRRSTHFPASAPAPGAVQWLAWLRLIAAPALERGGRDRNATALIRYAVTELASREALDQVLDLARRYGTDALGEHHAISVPIPSSRFSDKHRAVETALEATLAQVRKIIG